MNPQDLMAAMARRPALAGAAGGAAAGYAGEQVPLLSLLDAPGRAARGGVMAGLQGAGLQTGLITTASFLPALVGVGAGALASAIPGLAPAAGYIGAGAAGLAQQLGEYVDPGSFPGVSSGDLNTALGIPSNFATDMITNVATDPLAYAGAIGKGLAPGGGYAGPAGTSVFIPEAEAAAARPPMTLPAGNLHMGPPAGVGPAADAAESMLAGWKPPVGALDEAMGMPPASWMQSPPPISPGAAPLPPPAGNLHMGARNLAGEDAMLSGWNPQPAGLQDAAMASPSQWQALAPEVAPTQMVGPPMQGPIPGWMEQGNSASLGGYAPGPQKLMASTDQINAAPQALSPPGKSAFGSVQPDVAQALQDFGYMNATTVGPGGRTAGTLQAGLPEWASYRKPWLTATPGGAVPLVGDPMNLLAERQQAEEAMALFAQMLQGGPGGMKTIPGLPPAPPPRLFGPAAQPFDPLKTRLGG